MAPKSKFVLKDSPPEVIQAADVPPKGRSYSSHHAQTPGGVSIQDVVTGMKLASVAITDDEPDTLKNVAKMNPWQEEALTMITGSRENAHQPLSTILQDHFDLQMDCHINVSGWKHGRPLDTQGFIAHNDELIVLSYRCTTSALDWLTNFSTSSSEWEPEVDMELGHAGCCSCIKGYDWYNFCSGKQDAIKKPRVHTGFYNNFLYTTPDLQKHIVPLLQDTTKPRKLLVVGHSLGAGIAHLAATYLLLTFDWEHMPHKLVCVTAGSPRSMLNSMASVVEHRLSELRSLDKAVFCRIVLNEDVVTKVPPSLLGFTHVGKMVYITEEGEILINPSNENVIDDDELQELVGVNGSKTTAATQAAEADDDGDDTDDIDIPSASVGVKKDEKQVQYAKKVKMIPRPLKDHMPDFYLAPLVRLFEKEQKTGE